MRPQNVVSGIAERFISAAQDHLGMEATDIWRGLGYSNSSTLNSIRKGEALPDFARIAEHHGAIQDARGRVVNLHWVITGQGNPLLSSPKPGGKPSKNPVDHDIINRISRLKPSQRATLLKFLDEFS
jgi:hypothetical protein